MGKILNTIDVGTWKQDSKNHWGDIQESDIINKFKNCLEKLDSNELNEIWITGNYTKFTQAIENNSLFNVKVLSAIVEKNVYLTDDANNNLNYDVLNTYVWNKQILFDVSDEAVIDLKNLMDSSPNSIDEIQEKLLKFQWVQDDESILNKINNLSTLENISKCLDSLANSNKVISAYDIIQTFDDYPEIDDPDELMLHSLSGKSISEFIETEILLNPKELKNENDNQLDEYYLKNIQKLEKQLTKSNERGI